MRNLNIAWLNRCRVCGNKDVEVTTRHGTHKRLYEDDVAKCPKCGLNGVIQTSEGHAWVLWETDEEIAEGE